MMWRRFSYKSLYSSLVFLLLSASFLFVIVNAINSGHQTSDVNIRSRLEAAVRNLNEADLLMEEDSEDTEDNEVVADENEFQWKHHHDDHAVYAGRSLLLSENMKPQQSYSENEEDDDSENIRKSHSAITDDEELDPLKTKNFAEKEWQLMFRSFDSAYDSLSSSILQEIGKQTNLFQDIVSRLNPECQREIHYIRDSVKKHKLWALRMVDSMGKIPSGITYGRFSSPGDYEECLSVKVDEKLYTDVKNNIAERHKFHGKYCLIDFRLPLPERPPNKLLSIHESILNFTDTEIGRKYPDLISNYSAYASVFYEVGYLHAFCLPSTCEVTDVTKAIGKALEGMYLIVNNTIDCEERPEQPVPLRKSQWIAIVFLIVVFANAFIASVAFGLLPKDIRQPPANQPRRASMKPPLQTDSNLATKLSQSDDQTAGINTNRFNLLLEAKRLSIAHKQSSLKQALTELSLRHKFYSDCFSIQKNFERLTKPDPRGLTFVHYTRIVAMALTVITHTGALGTLQALTKPADASNSEQIFRDLIPQMLANAFTSIQIFFFMAGFMLVISTFPSIKREKGHISFMEYAIKRAIRLMPGLAATICLNLIWPLMVDGPMLKFFDKAIVEPCEKNWWHTMAFVSNFDHVEKMCLRHSYFSASDYQLHIIAFPLLVLLYKQPSLALFLAAIFTVSGFVAQIIMILTKTVLPFMMVDYIDKQAFFNVVHYIHHPVWNHMSAFFYGFIIGFLVVKQVRLDLSETTIKRVWLILMPAGIASIFAPYFWNHYKRPIYKWQMILYVIFDRFILLSTCAWLSYATMVLARKPPTRKSPEKPAVSSAPNHPESGTKTDTAKSPIEQVLTKGKPTSLTANDSQRTSFTSSQDIPHLSVQTTKLGLEGINNGLPRQRSSPNLVSLQQQLQLQLSQQSDDNKAGLGMAHGRLSKTVSSNNLTTIAEANQSERFVELEAKTDAARPAVREEAAQKSKPRNQAPVSNINILCLVLSRLTFQLYLFNMVVLCIDVNHSKYYWFFSYYFIIFKAASIYICSAIMAMIFFVVLESPSLTLYIAWVRGRAAAKARASKAAPKAAEDVTIAVPPPLTISIGDKKIGRTDTIDNQNVELQSPSIAKPTFSFIDLSSPSSEATSQVGKSLASKDQTKL